MTDEEKHEDETDETDEEENENEEEEKRANIGCEARQRMNPVYSGNMIMLGNQSAALIQPCYVNDDHTLDYDYGGQTKTIEILNEGSPKSCYIDLKYFLGSGLLFSIRYAFIIAFAKLLRISWAFSYVFNLYTSQITGEYTIDPFQDETPDDLRQQHEIQLELNNQRSKVDFLGMLIRGASDRKSIWDVAVWLIAIVLIILIFIIWLSGYNLVKA